MEISKELIEECVTNYDEYIRNEVYPPARRHDVKSLAAGFDEIFSGEPTPKLAGHPKGIPK